MRLIKDEFVRFFAVGFAGGAVLVFATMHMGAGDIATPSVVPAAHAAAAR